MYIAVVVVTVLTSVAVAVSSSSSPSFVAAPLGRSAMPPSMMLPLPPPVPRVAPPPPAAPPMFEALPVVRSPMGASVPTATAPTTIVVEEVVVVKAGMGRSKRSTLKKTRRVVVRRPAFLAPAPPPSPSPVMPDMTAASTPTAQEITAPTQAVGGSPAGPSRRTDIPYVSWTLDTRAQAPMGARSTATRTVAVAPPPPASPILPPGTVVYGVPDPSARAVVGPAPPAPMSSSVVVKKASPTKRTKASVRIHRRPESCPSTAQYGWWRSVLDVRSVLNV